MKTSVSIALVAVVLSVLLVAETESLRWPYRQRQRDSRGRAGRSRSSSSWSDFLRGLRRGWGRHNSFSWRGRSDPFDFGFEFSFGRQRNWWEGPNVCRSEETDNSTSDASTITHHFKTATQVCEESETAYRCKSTVRSSEGEITKVLLYECCHGYAREAGEFGCPERLRLADLPTTARNLDLNDLMTAVSAVGLDEELSRGNFTVFAPVDGSFPLTSQGGFTLQNQPARAVMVSRPLVDKMESDLQAILLGHLLPEPRKASSFSDEEILQTGSPYDSTIRINFYSRPEKLTTANCVKVTSTDNMATNGVIHIVDKVLPTVTSSLLDLIQRDEEFSYLKTALARANLVSTFKKDGQFTLFAPTNAAFQKLDSALRDRLLSGDPECLKKVLNQHVLPHVICSEVIQGRAKSRNLLSNYLNLTRTDDNKLFVDGAQVVRADVMATNGVLHVIDSVLVPDDALDLVTVAQNSGLTELVNLVQAASLVSKLQNADNVTVFAPSNEAIQALPSSLVRQLLADPTALQEVLTYHVVPEELSSRELYNDRVLDTLNAKGKVRINEYSSFPFRNNHVMTAQCASIITTNVAACNGIVHVIDKVLIRPSGNIVDVLAADPLYSTLVRLLKRAGLADALQEDGPFTVFAPTNEAFAQLGKETLKELEGDREQLASILKQHVFKGTLCCAGIFHNPWWSHQQIRTLGGGSLFLSRNRMDQPVVGDAVIGGCDNTATNGVVQGIDSVILPRPDPWYMFP